MSARPPRGSRLLLSLVLLLQSPRPQAQRSAKSPRRAPVAPKWSQRRARAVRCVEQRELAGWPTA
eukprot:2554405-Pyramimonas_sp.AAC.1